MGLDLKLLPFDGERGQFAYSQTVLRCERDTDFFNQIIELEDRIGKPVPHEFDSYLSSEDDGESKYGNTQDTPYGEQLRWVPVGELYRLFELERDNWANVNVAVAAYLSVLKPNQKIALFWE